MKKKWLSIFLCSFLSACCFAQTEGYRFYSILDSIPRSGFYNIELTPALSAHLKTDHSDLRIINSTGKWVPHILRFPASDWSSLALKMDMNFTRAENTRAGTTLVIENTDSVISNIGLVIRNTAAERFCTLSGSDDRNNWFIINDSILINPVPEEKGAMSKFRIDFPPSSYKFLKILIHNNNKDPFDIKGVVQHTSAPLPPQAEKKFVQNPVPGIEQKDSGKISYIKISQQEPYHFDGMSLKLSGVKYFSRKVSLFIPAGDAHSFSNPGRLLQSFTISNNSTLEFYVSQVKAATFYLLIYNEDNLPVTVEEVKTWTSYCYITSYLEKGDHYRILMDNPAAVMPSYDLARPDNKILDSIPFLSFGKITAIAENELTESTPGNKKWMIWVAIIVALLVLLYFISKMLKDVDKRKTS